MKKLIATFVAILYILIPLGCTDSEPVVITDGELVCVINVPDAPAEGTTLLKYMSALMKDGKLTFAESDGMVTEINGLKNADDFSECWMLYTSDTDNANSTWGEVVYSGNTYGSAIVGAGALEIKQGCVYIWVYTEF